MSFSTLPWISYYIEGCRVPFLMVSINQGVFLILISFPLTSSWAAGIPTSLVWAHTLFSPVPQRTAAILCSQDGSQAVHMLPHTAADPGIFGAAGQHWVVSRRLHIRPSTTAVLTDEDTCPRPHVFVGGQGFRTRPQPGPSCPALRSQCVPGEGGARLLPKDSPASQWPVGIPN